MFSEEIIFKTPHRRPNRDTILLKHYHVSSHSLSMPCVLCALALPHRKPQRTTFQLHQTANLSTAAQLRRSHLDSLRLTDPRIGLDEPFVPHFRVICLSPHGDFEFRVGRVIKWPLYTTLLVFHLPEVCDRGIIEGAYLDGEENREPRYHVLALLIDEFRMSADLNLFLVAQERCVQH